MAYVSATLQPLSGKSYTHFNTKLVYFAFLFVFELGSLICGTANSSLMFILGRVVAGAGASGIVNGALTMLAGAVPLEKSPLYTGALLGIGQLGILAGPLVGGSLTEHVTWRWCFYINLPIGGLAALSMANIHVPEVTEKQAFSWKLVKKTVPELDLFGFALFVPASTMFLLALQFGGGNAFPWRSATVIGLFCGAGAMGVLFILWERRMGARAMIPGPLLRTREVWTSCVFASTIMSMMIIASNWMPTYFQAVKGQGPTSSGVHILPGVLSQMLSAMASGAAGMSRKRYTLKYFPLTTRSLQAGILSPVGDCERRCCSNW